MALAQDDYFLACLSEEASEVVLAVMDVVQAMSEQGEAKRVMAVAQLRGEINDFHTVVIIMGERGVLLGSEPEPVSFINDAISFSKTANTEQALMHVVKCCAQMSQFVCKAQRFGLDDQCPRLKITNRAQIVQAINAVYGAFAMLKQLGVIPFELYDPVHVTHKRERLVYWLDHARGAGHIASTVEG